MNKAVVAIVAVAGLFAACAPVSQTPATPAAPASSGAAPAGKQAGVSFSGIKKADKTVAELYAGKAGLAGTAVSVRGKVVKFSAQIMGKNWVHVQDGTGSSGTNDLTATTANTAKVGDIVLVSGKITQNKDFGGGYKYALVLEDAKVTVEAK